MKKTSKVPVAEKKQKKYEPTVKQLGEDEVDADILETAGKMAKLNARRRIIDSELDELKILLRALMEDVNDGDSWSVPTDTYTATFVKAGKTTTLVKELLIQAGVTMKQLQKGVRETPKEPYVQVVLKKEK